MKRQFNLGDICEIVSDEGSCHDLAIGTCVLVVGTKPSPYLSQADDYFVLVLNKCTRRNFLWRVPCYYGTLSKQSLSFKGGRSCFSKEISRIEKSYIIWATNTKITVYAKGQFFICQSDENVLSIVEKRGYV